MAGYHKYKNFDSGEYPFFVTTTVVGFTPLFNTVARRSFVTACLLYDLHYYQAKLGAFVVMDHHLHFICKPPDGRTCSWLLNRFKSNCAKCLLPLLCERELALLNNSRRATDGFLWKRSFRSFALSQDLHYNQKLNYIHNNPVRSRACSTPEEYAWSSARFFTRGMWSEESGLGPIDEIAREFAPVPPMQEWKSR